MPSGGRSGRPQTPQINHLAPNPAKPTELRKLRKLPKSIRDKKDLVLDTLRAGGTFKLAAAGIGITDRALRYWRDNPEFEVQCRMAQAEHCMEQIANVKRAAKGDCKAALAFLKHHRLTREDFSDRKRPQAVTVTVGFDRKGIIVDGERTSIR